MKLGERQFTDGATRSVYRSDDGRQYVLDDEGEPVYGVWLHPSEYSEPIVVELTRIMNATKDVTQLRH